MIVIERKVIHNIPVLEMVEEERREERLPLAVFFHGVTNQKEKGLEPGYELAKQGIRVVIPDAFLHGERKKEAYNGQKQMEFWSIVWRSLEEFPFLVDHYVTENLALQSRVYVTGLSMGGITVCMAMARYPWIYAGGCLMGNPDPIGFTDWILTSHWTEGMEPVDREEAISLMAPFREVSLKERPDKIAGRPFFVWHGTEDQSVPFDQMNDFIAQIESESYAAQVKFIYYEGHGHKVPYDIYEQMAEFLGQI